MENGEGRNRVGRVSMSRRNMNILLCRIKSPKTLVTEVLSRCLGKRVSGKSTCSTKMRKGVQINRTHINARWA